MSGEGCGFVGKEWMSEEGYVDGPGTSDLRGMWMSGEGCG